MSEFIHTTELRQIWIGSAWLDDSRSTYTYDANNNIISQIFQYWQNNVWLNNSRYLFNYNSNNIVTEEIDQKWNLIAGIWNNYYRISGGYDANDYLYYTTFQRFDLTSGMILQGDSDYIYYHTVTVGIPVFSTEHSLLLYPNPAVNFIHLNPVNLTKGELKIVNCNGQVVYVESLQLITKESELKINISTFPKGIYFIQLVGDENNRYHLVKSFRKLNQIFEKWYNTNSH